MPLLDEHLTLAFPCQPAHLEVVSTLPHILLTVFQTEIE